MIPSGSSILEIGAGSGFQAKILADHGFQVFAIDVKEGLDSAGHEWPVQEYDGSHIPFPDQSFDIVFTSNVLEHIETIGILQDEIRRVLRTEGIAVHSMPTGTWRFHTTLAHYPFLFKQLWKLFFLRPDRQISETQEISGRKSLWEKAKKVFVAPRHGARGNVFSEIYFFSRFFWLDLFRRSEWAIEKYFRNRLFYTGYAILGLRLSIPTRHFLSYVLGSSGHIFILKKRI